MNLLLVLMGAGPLSDCSGSQQVSAHILKITFLHRLAFPLLSSKFLSTEKENYNSSLSLNPCLGWTVVLFSFRSQESHRKAGSAILEREFLLKVKICVCVGVGGQKNKMAKKCPLAFFNFFI